MDAYAADRILLGKDIVTLYEDVPDFRVAVNSDGRVVGCGAVHVMWEDLAEVRTLAVLPEFGLRVFQRPSGADLAGALGVGRTPPAGTA